MGHFRTGAGRAVAAAGLVSLLLTACSGGGGAQPPLLDRSKPAPASGEAPSVTVVTYSLARSGGTFALPSSEAYDGSLSVGPNAAPPGTRLRLALPTAAAAQADKTGFATTTPADPFPIAIGIQVPFSFTIPVPGFTLHFRKPLNIAGTFDVEWFDPTLPENPPANPRLLGIAVASGNTLTFTPPPNETLSLVANVNYTLSILRDVSSSYSGGANSVLLPVQSGVQQELATVGPLGAGANYQASLNQGFLLWQTINGAPAGVPPLLFNDNPIESLVVSATQSLTLTSATLTAEFTPPTPSLASVQTTVTNAPGPGTFVPDTNPTVVGPFPATVLQGGKIVFTATQPGGFALGGNKAWNFSVVTVTACVPINATVVCDDGTPNNVRTYVGVNQQFDVLVADESGLLTNAYGLNVSGACSTAGINQNDNNGDIPAGYNDSPMGPKSEFEVASGATPGTCLITATYNGGQVAQTSINVTAPTYARSASPIRYTLRPPVNGPSGIGVSGHI